MSFTIDTTVSAAALLGGLVGALLTAYLSYRVQKAVRDWEDRRKRGRILFVHYLQATDMVATDAILSPVAKVLATTILGSEADGDLNYKAAAWIADAIDRGNSDALSQTYARMQSTLPIIEDLLGKLQLSAEELSQFPATGVVAYNRLTTCTMGFRIQLVSLRDHLKLDPAKLDAAFIHNVHMSWRRYCDAATQLRIVLADSLGRTQIEQKSDLDMGLKRQGQDLIGTLTDSMNIGKVVESMRASGATTSAPAGGPTKGVKA